MNEEKRRGKRNAGASRRQPAGGDPEVRQREEIAENGGATEESPALAYLRFWRSMARF